MGCATRGGGCGTPHICKRGATFGVCPPCAEYSGAVGNQKRPWVTNAGGDWLMENIQGAWVLWM